MNIEFGNQVYRELSKYLKEKSAYEPNVTRKNLRQSERFPLVTLMETNSTNDMVTTTFEETVDRITFTIDIYAQDKVVGNTTISDVNICRELMGLVDDVMGKRFRMQRNSCRPTPNIDKSIYRVTMRYVKKLNTKKNLFI